MPVHFIFDLKHGGPRKAHLIADVHLTDIPLDSVYSGLTQLMDIKLTMFRSVRTQLKMKYLCGKHIFASKPRKWYISMLGHQRKYN